MVLFPGRLTIGVPPCVPLLTMDLFLPTTFGCVKSTLSYVSVTFILLTSCKYNLTFNLLTTVTPKFD